MQPLSFSPLPPVAPTPRPPLNLNLCRELANSSTQSSQRGFQGGIATLHIASYNFIFFTSHPPRFFCQSEGEREREGKLYLPPLLTIIELKL